MIGYVFAKHDPPDFTDRTTVLTAGPAITAAKKKEFDPIGK
jgi:hypothetical protein